MPLDDTTPNTGVFEPFNQQSRIMFPVAERKVGWLTRAGAYDPIRSHKAIIRTTEGGDGVHVLNVVGATYKLIHNKELFGHIESTLCKKMQPDALDGVQVHDKVSGFGRVCMREYVFPNIKCRLTGGIRHHRAVSEIAFRLIVQNGYGGSALRIHAGAIDFYCTNGMISGEYQSTYHKHTAGLVVSGIDATVERALDTFANSHQKWTRWVDTPVGHEQAMQLFRDLATSDKLRDNLSQQYLRDRDERGDNLWAVYSTLTYYASHNDGDFKLRNTVEAQDTVASTMLQRELTVAKWITTDAWRKLETV
jgi:hypothetical protein